MAKKSRQSTGSQVAPVASPAATPKSKTKQATTPKSATPVSKRAVKAPTPEPEVPAADEDWEDEESEDEDEDDDEEDDGVTEEGMQRLMALLQKENALDDFDMAQLGEGSDDEEASDDEEEEEEEGDAEMDAQIDDDDAPAKPSKRVRIATEQDVQPATEGDLALDDLESDLSVDEDAIPQRKVTKNNKVSQNESRYALSINSSLSVGRSGSAERGNHGDKHAVWGTLDVDVVRGSLGS
jgi:rRNA-processing protein EBP2